MLQDSFGRTINYLRLAVTDRCNLRCTYCMPEEGLNWLSQKKLMSYNEMLRICSLLVKMGIQKIRITGGEPFMRKDMLQFLTALSRLKGIRQLTITTNGVLTAPLIPELKKIGIHSVNLSLDTLDNDRFMAISHRNELSKVLKTLDTLLVHDIDTKINCVVMEDKNIGDIIPLAELTRSLPLSVRFIEEMPFNGSRDHHSALHWNYIRILDKLKDRFPDIQKNYDPPHSTSINYHIPGHKGNIGIIAAYSRLFCGSCNRIRITPEGALKTCLYGKGFLNIKNLIREGVDEDELQKILKHAILKKAKDGWEAEKEREFIHESMATIGG